MQAYCFRFYFLLVTVIMFGAMVLARTMCHLTRPPCKLRFHLGWHGTRLILFRGTSWATHSVHSQDRGQCRCRRRQETKGCMSNKLPTRLLLALLLLAFTGNLLLLASSLKMCSGTTCLFFSKFLVMFQKSLCFHCTSASEGSSSPPSRKSLPPCIRDGNWREGWRWCHSCCIERTCTGSHV